MRSTERDRFDWDNAVGVEGRGVSSGEGNLLQAEVEKEFEEEE